MSTGETLRYALQIEIELARITIARADCDRRKPYERARHRAELERLEAELASITQKEKEGP